MSKKSGTYYISDSNGNILAYIKQIFKRESFLIPIIVFGILYFFILLQKWVDITLILIPLINFFQYLFYNIIHELNVRIRIEDLEFEHKPFGNEKKISDRLFFLLIIEMFIIYVIGAESYRFPQLIEDFFYLYMIPLVSLFIFSLYYCFYDIGTHARFTATLINEKDLKIEKDEKNNLHSLEIISNHLEFKEIKALANIVTTISILLLFSWLLFSIFDIFGVISHINIIIPGTNLYEGTSLRISYIIYVILVLEPLSFVFITFRVFKTISSINMEEIKEEFGKLTKKQKYIFRRIVEYR